VRSDLIGASLLESFLVFFSNRLFSRAGLVSGRILPDVLGENLATGCRSHKYGVTSVEFQPYFLRSDHDRQQQVPKHQQLDFTPAHSRVMPNHAIIQGLQKEWGVCPAF